MLKRGFVLFFFLALCLGIALPAFAAQAENPLSIRSIALGDHHGLALAEDGKLWAWGPNWYGALGNGTPEDRVLGLTFVMDGVIAADAGTDHSAAITADGSLWTWGRNTYGAIGDGTFGEGDYITDASGERKLVAGAIGDGTMHPTPVKVLDEVVAVEAGHFVTFAIRQDGSLWGWGRNEYGELGDSTCGYNNMTTTPKKLMENVAAVRNAGTFTLILQQDGSLWSCGVTYFEYFFDCLHPSPEEVLVLATPAKIMDGVQAIAAGMNHALTLKADGSLWAWGSNSCGQLGDGFTVNRDAPWRVMNGVSAISAGMQHSLALKPDGSLWVWGDGSGGQAGDGLAGPTHFLTAPYNVLNDVEQFAVGQMSCIALKIDGSIWGWGPEAFLPDDSDGVDSITGPLEPTPLILQP